MTKQANKLIGTDSSIVVTRGERVGEVEEGKGGPMHGDGRRLDFGW